MSESNPHDPWPSLSTADSTPQPEWKQGVLEQQMIGLRLQHQEADETSGMLGQPGLLSSTTLA